MKIKRNKQPDNLEYKSKDKTIKVYNVDSDTIIINAKFSGTTVNFSGSIILELSQAKELAKVLPKFLEEMEK